MKAEIYVNRFEEEQGPYSPDQIEEMLTSGRLSPEDRYWHGGRADWASLSEFDLDKARASAEVRREERGAEVVRKKLVAGIVLGVVAIGITLFIFIRDARQADELLGESVPPEDAQMEEVAPAKEADFAPKK